ncbi:hypothetical protein B0G74_9040 [Paraburkholderia sp. BL9I2N2]|nr:hypothetical protein B0G74_9040 [Paraburkholderia sp. BL9I2N2]
MSHLPFSIDGHFLDACCPTWSTVDPTKPLTDCGRETYLYSERGIGFREIGLFSRSPLPSFLILSHGSTNGFQKVGARFSGGEFGQLARSLGVGFQRQTVELFRCSHISSPASMTVHSDGELGLAPRFRKSRFRIFTKPGVVHSVRCAPPGFVGALLSRFHCICYPLLTLRSWRKRRSQTGKCPADGPGDHSSLRVRVGKLSLGPYVKLALLYV